MAKRWLVPLTWVACTLGAMGLAWFAVSSVLSGTAEQVTPVAAAGVTTTTARPSTTTTLAPGDAAESSATEAAESTAAGPAPVSGAAPAGDQGEGPGGGADDGAAPPPASIAPPPTSASTVTGTFSSQGGVVTVSCTGTTAALVSASPQPGYSVEVEDRGPVRVRVRFEGSGHESDVRVTCSGGQPVPEVNEQGG